MTKLKVLITAGPTREYLDPVRYISNDSSGRMGFALAAAAKKFKADVTLIAGPVFLPTPKGVKRIDVVSALDMQQAVLKHQKKADVIIMCAAVADFRPLKFLGQKIKRASLRSRRLTIPLKENPDILYELGKKKRPDQLLVGFAVETKNLEHYAHKKLKEKKCDFLIANHHTVIGKEKAQAILISKTGRRIFLPLLNKEELAFLIFSHLLSEGKLQERNNHPHR